MINFVGAGPGAVDLITVRGQRLLAEADVVVYAGSLVNPDLLKNTKEGCVVYNSASMTLEEVTGVLIAGAQEGKAVVRLHTGDPSLYGAIREQMDILDEHNLKYDVVPGVSSFCAAAAALKAEYTLPQVSQTVIITRMEGRTPVPCQENIPLLAKHQATMVIFLSAGMVGELVEKLLKEYRQETPAAIVYKASWQDERVIRTTVGGLETAAREAGITKTALILVGNFLSGEYARSLLYHPQFSHGFRKGEQDLK